ncbi:laccase [Camillea tinctor]|nr:laccase [Camillea tinctor]
MGYYNLLFKVVTGLLLINLATSTPTFNYLANRQSNSSCNTPENRSCWSDGFDINTDYDTNIPVGVTREYDLVITNVTSFAPDGYAKGAMLVNGTFPGPTIIGNWGDTFKITVHNQLSDNGTSIHWHGIRQLNTSTQDGSNGVTECPIPGDGGSKTYTFRATQYGTSWYHSHFSAQYGEGVLGAIQINGPASANYDIDLGPYVITDWYRRPAFELERASELATSQRPPVSSNILFNGSNINPDTTITGGQYNRVTLTPGKKHRLRIINTSVENHFTVSLVGHNFTVISTDFVPVTPIVMPSLFVAIGQRYDVIIDAAQAVDNYWFNATVQTGLCGATTNIAPASIFSYDGASTTSLPTDVGVPLDTVACVDNTGFTPVLARSCPSDQFNGDNILDITLATPTIGNVSVFRWQVNSQDIDIMWDKPTLQYVQEGNTSYPAAANVIAVDEANIWTFWVVQNENNVPHPIHLHGHDFLVLGTSDTTTASSGDLVVFNATTDVGSLNFDNPTRRDVAMLPSNGWLVLAWVTDNPGAWLMHCHIAWHVSQGLSVQFLERRNEIPDVMDLSVLEPDCNEWSQWFPNNPYMQTDSGL